MDVWASAGDWVLRLNERHESPIWPDRATSTTMVAGGDDHRRIGPVRVVLLTHIFSLYCFLLSAARLVSRGLGVQRRPHKPTPVVGATSATQVSEVPAWACLAGGSDAMRGLGTGAPRAREPVPQRTKSPRSKGVAGSVHQRPPTCVVKVCDRRRTVAARRIE